MALRNLRINDDEILQKKAKPVEKFDEKLHQLLADMAETMQASNGVGLAAPQIGILRRIVVVDVGEGLIELMNPEIVEELGEQDGEEGCLSLPGLSGDVVRPMKVKVEAQDRKGQKFTIEGEELLARAFCHEIDHLNGILFTKRATRVYDKKKNTEQGDN